MKRTPKRINPKIKKTRENYFISSSDDQVVLSSDYSLDLSDEVCQNEISWDYILTLDRNESQLGKSYSKQYRVLETRTFRQESDRQVNQYYFEKILGRGTYATVYLCRNVQNNILYAVKEMVRNGESETQELGMLRKMNHPNVLWLHEVIDDPSKELVYLVTDYQSGGSINKLAGASSEVLRKHFVEVLKALFYIHVVLKVIHRDIKPENIMLNANGEAVLTDFGKSSQEPKDIEGTLIFWAPEMF